MLPIALSSGEAILVIFFAALPVGALTFAMGAGNALGQIGKGALSIEQEMPQKGGGSAPVSAEVREAEIRQLLEAKAHRQRMRGEEPLDVETELQAILEEDRGGGVIRDAQLIAEVRQLVVARNARRARQGKEPLDVEGEVARQLRDLEGLGQ